MIIDGINITLDERLRGERLMRGPSGSLYVRDCWSGKARPVIHWPYRGPVVPDGEPAMFSQPEPAERAALLYLATTLGWCRASAGWIDAVQRDDGEVFETSREDPLPCWISGGRTWWAGRLTR